VEQHYRRRLWGEVQPNDYLVEAMQAGIPERVEGDEGGSRFFFAPGPQAGGPVVTPEPAAQGPCPAMSNLSALVRASGSRFTAATRRNTGSPAGMVTRRMVTSLWRGVRPTSCSGEDHSTTLPPRSMTCCPQAAPGVKASGR
jgi:hypothetical protein